MARVIFIRIIPLQRHTHTSCAIESPFAEKGTNQFRREAPASGPSLPMLDLLTNLGVVLFFSFFFIGPPSIRFRVRFFCRFSSTGIFRRSVVPLASSVGPILIHGPISVRESIQGDFLLHTVQAPSRPPFWNASKVFARRKRSAHFT